MSAKQIKHIELFGGYTGKRKIIIDAAEAFPGEYSVMAMYISIHAPARGATAVLAKNLSLFSAKTDK